MSDKEKFWMKNMLLFEAEVECYERLDELEEVSN